MLRSMVFALVTLVLLGALWVGFKPAQPGGASTRASGPELQSGGGAPAAPSSLGAAAAPAAAAPAAGAPNPAGASSNAAAVPSSDAGAASSRSVASPASSNATPAGQVFTFVVNKGRLESGLPVMQVHEGEHVTVRITSDHADEVHLHG